MNERIRELAVECTFHTYGVNGELLYDGFNEEKFAKLIVRECLHNMENCDGDLDFAIWKTKRDFGVE